MSSAASVYRAARAGGTIEINVSRRAAEESGVAREWQRDDAPPPPPAAMKPKCRAARRAERRAAGERDWAQILHNLDRAAAYAEAVTRSHETTFTDARLDPNRVAKPFRSEDREPVKTPGDADSGPTDANVRLWHARCLDVPRREVGTPGYGSAPGEKWRGGS